MVNLPQILPSAINNFISTQLICCERLYVTLKLNFTPEICLLRV